MNVCVVGWYYLPAFYEVLRRYTNASPVRRVTVIAHRPGDARLFTREHANVGLEWGAYAHYLQTEVPALAPEPTLFMHDDALVPEDFFERVAAQAAAVMDLAFIFRDPEEARINGGAHGRCFYLSPRLLTIFRTLGFWYDAENLGDLTSPQSNAGIQHFLRDVQMIRERPSGHDLMVGRLFVDGADFGYRGQVGLDGAAYRMTHFVGG